MQTLEKEPVSINLTRSEITDAMRDDINLFMKKFKLKYNTSVYVSVNTQKNITSKLDLDELRYIVETHMRKKYVFDSVTTIKDKTRKRPIVMYRQIFCKLARTIGYGLTSIGVYLDMNHATVFHSIKTIDDLIETKNVLATECINDLYLIIESHIIIT